jgi:flagellar basal-body rod protein FlgG
VLEDGLPIARLGVFEAVEGATIEALGGALFRASDGAMREVETPLVRQGMLESANVDLSREMIDMMAAMRQAEIGARIVQAYDGLVGQSITTFGRTSR